MISLPPVDSAAALAWAKRLYAPLLGRSQSDATNSAERALEGFRAVSRKFPEEGRARLGAARCLFRMGRYQASVAEYLAFEGARDERATAMEFAQAASRLRTFLPVRHRLIHLVRIDRRQWVAVTGRWGPVFEDEGPLAFTDVSLQRFRVAEGVSRIGKPIELNPQIGPRIDVNVFAPTAIRPYFSVQSTEAKAASAVSCDVQMFRAGSEGLRAWKPLMGIYDTEVWNEGRSLCAAVCPTYKLVWYDVYQWKGAGFRFANFRYPERYVSVRKPKDDRDSLDYGGWAHYAAALTIRGRRQEAIRAWRRAAWILVGHLKEPENYYGRYFFFDGYGSAKVSLAQARQRIRWLERRDGRHALLYRPYDFNLQVPPYRLGNAWPEE